MNGKRVPIGICILALLCVSASAQERYSVSGVIAYLGNGPIHLYLVDEETSRAPSQGVQTITLVPDQTDGSLPFTFTDIPVGTYGIRCFQDANRNGELDRGLMGPREPWGMSWQHERPRMWPAWDDWSFEVNGDISGVRISLE